MSSPQPKARWADTRESVPSRSSEAEPNCQPSRSVKELASSGLLASASLALPAWLDEMPLALPRRSRASTPPEPSSSVWVNLSVKVIWAESLERCMRARQLRYSHPGWAGFCRGRSAVSCPIDRGTTSAEANHPVCALESLCMPPCRRPMFKPGTGLPSSVQAAVSVTWPFRSRARVS